MLLTSVHQDLVVLPLKLKYPNHRSFRSINLYFIACVFDYVHSEVCRNCILCASHLWVRWEMGRSQHDRKGVSISAYVYQSKHQCMSHWHRVSNIFCIRVIEWSYLQLLKSMNNTRRNGFSLNQSSSVFAA